MEDSVEEGVADETDIYVEIVVKIIIIQQTLFSCKYSLQLLFTKFLFAFHFA